MPSEIIKQAYLDGYKDGFESHICRCDCEPDDAEIWWRIHEDRKGEYDFKAQVYVYTGEEPEGPGRVSNLDGYNVKVNVEKVKDKYHGRNY